MSTTEEETTSSRYSRRGFLRRAGVGAGAVAMSGGLTAAFAPQAARSATVSTSPTTFGRIFPSLPPFAQPSATSRPRCSSWGSRAAYSMRRTI